MKRILLTIFCAFIQYSWAQIYEENIRSQKLHQINVIRKYMEI